MLKSERMSKLTVIGPKTAMDKAVETLYSLKVYHIVDHKKTESLDIGSPMERAGEISDALVKVRSLCSSLGIEPKDETVSARLIEAEGSDISAEWIAGIKKKAEKISSELSDSAAKLKSASDGLQSLKERRSLLEKLRLLRLDPEDINGYSTVSYMIGQVGQMKMKDIGLLKAELDRKTSRYTLKHYDHEGKTLIALFIEAGKKGHAIDLLSRHGFTEMDLSRAAELKGDTARQLRLLDEDESRLSSRRAQFEKDIKRIRRDEREFLLVSERILAIESEKAEAPLRFASTEKAFVITGWVPRKKLDETVRQLNRATNDKLYIRSDDVKKGEDIPVRLKNPKIVEPFEFFMDLYTLPTYKEIDPSFLMFLTFPLFYGFMLGDVGYGVITLILFLCLRKKLGKDLGRLVNAMIFASISAIVFGFVFGEVFGLEGFMGYEFVRLLSRSHQMNELMYIAIAIGAVHINIGLMVGFINELMAHGLKAAFFEKISWIVMEAGAALIALTYMDILPLKTWVGFTVLAIGIIFIYMGEGAKGLIELPSIFSQMISYARLMAVGLASVILAEVINELSGELFHSGIVGIIVGIFVLVIGHVINIALGLISPFLHSLRLHYVEFFTKFYHGGGMRYVPFGTGERQE